MKHIMSKLKGFGMTTIGVVFALAMFVMMNMEVMAQAEGTVTADSAKIRSEASTSSNAVSSVKKGDKLTITEETTGSDGMVWYKVFVDADTLGYIRSDLIEKGEGSISQGTSSSVSVTPITQQSATVTGNNVRVRDNAGTSGSIVTTIQNGTGITLTGEATGNDGKKWYQVSFTNGTNTVTGFIRSDFIQIDETVVVPEETPAEGNDTQTEQPAEEETTTEEPVEEQVEETVPANKDYEVVYKQDTEGEFHWYLNNYVEGKGYKVAELLDAQEANAEYLAQCAKTINNQKMIIAVLAILLAALLIIITLMTFKIRDYAYEEEEERGKFEERAARTQKSAQSGNRPVQRRPAGEVQRRPAAQRPAGEGQKRPVSQGNGEGQRRPATAQRPVGQKPAGQKPTGQRQMPEGQRRPVAAQRPVEQGVPAKHPQEEKKAPAVKRDTAPATEIPVRRERPAQKVTVTDNGWKSKNFLTEDDDEFEFEFLNLDNDDE